MKPLKMSLNYSDGSHLPLSSSVVYIRGWKQIAKYLGINVRTVYEYHRKVLKLPFFKMSQSQTAAVRIDEEHLKLWLKKVIDLRKKVKDPENKRHKKLYRLKKDLKDRYLHD